MLEEMPARGPEGAKGAVKAQRQQLRYPVCRIRVVLNE